MKELITLVQPAFDWTWKNSVQAAVLIGLVLMVQKVLGRWLTPRLRYALSLLILLRLLLPAAPPSPLSFENLFTSAARITTGEAVSSMVAEPAGPIASMGAGPIPAASPPARPAVVPFASAAPSGPPALSAAETLGLAWACGLLLLVSLAGWGYVQWCRLIRQGRQLSHARLLALLDGAREAMGVRRPVTLVAVAHLSSPAVFGFWRVRLLLPEDALAQLTDQDLRLLFLHEMAHVRRQDMLLNLLLMAVQFVHWFNPLVWLGLHRLRADRELVCDAMVLQRTRPEERSNYGSLLLKLLTDFPPAQQIIPTAVQVVSSKREIKRRIVSIKHHRRASLAACVATGIAAVALACLTFTGSSQQPPAGEPRPQSARAVADPSLHQSTHVVVIDGKRRLITERTPWTNDQLMTNLMAELAKHPKARDQAAVRLTSQQTNNVFSAYDSDLADAVQNRWRELLDYRCFLEKRPPPPPTGSVTLEVRVYSDGQVGEVRTVQNSWDQVFALLAQQAVLDPAPYKSWPAAMGFAQTNKFRIVRLNFSFQEEPIKHLRTSSLPVSVATSSAAAAEPMGEAPAPSAGARLAAIHVVTNTAIPGASSSTSPQSLPRRTRNFWVDPNALMESLHVRPGPMETNGSVAIERALIDYLARAGVDAYGTRDPRNPFRYIYDGHGGLLVEEATLQDLEIIDRALAELRATRPAPAGQDPGGHQSTNLVVKIDDQGNITLGQTPVTIDQLRTYLMAESAKHPQLCVDIRADKIAPLKAIVNVMDVIKGARTGGVMLSTSIRETQAATAPDSNKLPRTILMRPGIQEARQSPPSAAALQRLAGQTDVRFTSQETNGLFSAYDQELAAAVGKRWRELLAEGSYAPPLVSVTLEFQDHSDGRVTDMRVVQSQGGEVFALIAQKAVLDPAPYQHWLADMRRALTNEYRIVRLSFSCQEQAK